MHEADSIDAGRQMMLGFGTAPMGAYYPTGIERADNIEDAPLRIDLPACNTGAAFTAIAIPEAYSPTACF